MTSTERFAWRAIAPDVALVVAVGALAALGMWKTADYQLPTGHPTDTLGFVLVTVGALALLARRRWPLTVLAVTTGVAASLLALSYPYGPPFLAMGVAMYVVADRLPWQRSLAACGAAYMLVFAVTVTAAGGRLLSGLPVMLAGAAGWLVLPFAVGAVLRVRRDDLAQSRDEEASRHAYAERLRIAREIHDVVGHRLAAMNMQSAVALYVADRRPEQAHESLEEIKKSSKAALQDLRATLAMLTSEHESSAPRRPRLGLGELDALISTMTDSGLRVEVVVIGAHAELPAAVDLAAYRIVQQSLADVLRQTTSTAATVRIVYTVNEVLIEVTDDRVWAITDNAQVAVGMRERATAVGGELTAGPRAGGFGVQVRLPVRTSRV